MDSESRSNPPDRTQPQAYQAQNHWRVNLAEAWEIRFWTREFGCSDSQLKEAVEAVGDSAGAVRAYLHDQDKQQLN